MRPMYATIRWVLGKAFAIDSIQGDERESGRICRGDFAAVLVSFRPPLDWSAASPD